MMSRSRQLHLSRRRLNYDGAIPVLGIEFLPGQQSRRLPYRLRDYQTAGGIDGSFHW